MIQVGVIGTGTWGKNHVRVWHEVQNVKLTAIADQDGATVKELSSKYGIRGETDYKKLLQDSAIDAVSICTPSSTHYTIAAEALKAGKHVLLEKPMALQSKECMQLSALAEKMKKTLMIGHVFRFDPLVQTIKQEIQNGTLGTVDFIYTSRLGLMTPRPDCGVIFDFALHDIDIACFLLDQLPKKVTAVGNTYRNKNARAFEDVGFITLEFPDGVLANAAVSWLTPKKVRDLWVIGSTRSIGADLITQQGDIYDKGIVPHYDNFGEFKLIRKSGSDTKMSVQVKEPLQEEILHFIDCVLRGKMPLVPGTIGTQMVKIIEACYQSIREHKTIEVEYD